MNLIDKILDFLGGNPFETEEEYENRKLTDDFYNRLEKIQNDNKINVIETILKPSIVANYLHNTGLLITEDELDDIANKSFNLAKQNGAVDEFNNLKGFTSNGLH